MSRAWRNGSTRAWRRTRGLILANNQATNGGRCQIALPGQWRTRDGQLRHCLGQADCVHHTAGARYGHDPKQLVAACTPCNLKIGDPDRAPDPAPKPMTRW